MPPGKGAISCSRQLPGPSLGVACGCGDTSQTGVICRVMDRSDLLEAEQIPACPIAGFHALSVDPARRVSVCLDLHVLAQFLGPDRAALVQQFPHLVEDERVAFQRGGVVGFLVPQVVLDVFGLSGAREAAEAGVEFLDGLVEPGVDHCSRWSPRGNVAQWSTPVVGPGKCCSVSTQQTVPNRR